MCRSRCPWLVPKHPQHCVLFTSTSLGVGGTCVSIVPALHHACETLNNFSVLWSILGLTQRQLAYSKCCWQGLDEPSFAIFSLLCSQPPAPTFSAALLRSSPWWLLLSLHGLVPSDATQVLSVTSHPLSGDAHMCTSSQAPSLNSGCGYCLTNLTLLPRWPRNYPISIPRLKVTSRLPCGPVSGNLLANAGDMGSIPDPGRFHMRKCN